MAERDELAAALAHEQALRRSLEQQLLLSGAQQLAQKKRFLVSGSLLALGIVGILVTFPMAALAIFGLIHDGASGYAWSGSAISAGLLLAAAMPVDTRVIRATAGLGIVAPAGVVLISFIYCAVTLTGLRCTHGSAHLCTISGWFYAATGVISLPVPICFLMSLRPRPGAALPRIKQVWQWARLQMGFALAAVVCATCLPIAWALATPEKAFAHEPRQALRFYWAIFRAWLLALTIPCIAATIVSIHQGHAQPSTPLVASWIFEAVTLFAVSALASRRNRTSMHTAMTRAGMRSESSAAAGIASLIGRIDPKTALSTAQRAFCGIPFSKVLSQLLQ